MGNRIGAIVEFQTESRVASVARPANTTPYDAGDCISAITTDKHLTFLECANAGPSRLTGVISAAKLWSSANVAVKLDAELWLFSADIVNVADGAAFAPSDAEMLTCIGVIPFATADWYVGKATAGAGGNAICQAMAVGIPYQLRAVGGGASPPVIAIYGQLVARNAYIPVTDEIFTVELLLTLD